VIYKPQSSLPSSGTREGEVVYNNSDNQLYVYKGSSLGWQAIGTGGITYTYYCFSNSSYGTPGCTNAGGSQGYCPAGYTQKASLGSWGYCHGRAPTHMTTCSRLGAAVALPAAAL